MPRGHVIPFPLVRIIAYAIAATSATLALGTVAPQLISFDDAATVLLFGVIVGVIDSILKPVIRTLSIPITCLTFGLFALVINVGLYYLAGQITPGMNVNWWGALFGSLLTSLAAGLMFAVVDES
jgi:putative membrane protein